MRDSIRAVAFDGYGTLIEFTVPHFLAAMEELVRAHGADADPQALWERFVEAAKAVRGESYHEPIYRRYEEAWALQFERAARDLGFQGDGRLAAARLKSKLSEADAFAEVPAVLAALRDRYRLAVLSNADDDFLLACLARNGLEFEAVVTSEMAGAIKPDPRIFHHLAEVLGLPPEQILYVGDWPMPDIVGARRAGVPVAWLNRHGHTLPPDIPAPDLEVASLTELLPVLVG
ncbi:MAG TPA: HAD family hydrolase [Dehalococcoidia bacterium]|nr:HAD family hydrolase [Dehalococcoidia bacterium]